MSDEPEGGDVAQAEVDAGAAADVAVGEADVGEADIGDGIVTQENVDETATKIEELPNSTEHHIKLHSDHTRPTFGDADHVEVDRTNLEAILDVSHRLKTRRSKKSMSILALASESYKDKQVNKSSEYMFCLILFVETELI